MSKLSKKELMLNVVLPLFTFVLGVFGSFLLSRLVPEKEDKIIRMNKIDGYNQQLIKEIPYVQAFKEYLSYIVKKDTAQIWRHMSEEFQKSFGSTNNLVYSYYLTNKYNIKFVIPIKDNCFYVYLHFDDNVITDEIIDIKKYVNTHICELNDSAKNNLSEEIYRYLDRRFVIEDKEFVMAKIQDHLSKMTMKEYVIQDWRLPIHIAADLQLPTKTLDRKKVDRLQGHDMICEVEMEFDSDLWKVKKFEMLAISRWN